jgi:hypothetical protein
MSLLDSIRSAPYPAPRGRILLRELGVAKIAQVTR